MSDQSRDDNQLVSEDVPKDPIEGLVADILNEREVVLNIGRNHKVELGMTFSILDNLDYVVKDPETGEDLGTLPPREKIRVRVVELTDKLSIARTYGSRKRNVGGVGFAGISAMRDLLEAPRYVEVPNTFRIGEGATYFKQISPEESVVQVGDRVRQVIETKQ